MIIYYNGQEINAKDNATILEVFEEEIQKSKNIILAAKCNNKIVSLKHMLENNDKIELIDIKTEEGMRIYRRGLLFVLNKAFYDIYYDAKIYVNYQLSNALYCDIYGLEVTNEVIEKIENKMREIITKDLEFKKVIMTREDAIEFYNKEKFKNGILQLAAKDKPHVSLYYCEDYYDYFYGTLPISAGYMKIYEIKKYKDGFLIRYPSKENPEELPPFEENTKLLKTLEEYDSIHKGLNIDTIEKLNKAVRENRIKEVVLTDEALHEKKISDIADDILKRKNVKMILIAGPSSSGKTTFAQRLGIQLKINGIKPVTISVDNYFVERENTPRDENGKYDFEALEAVDLELFNNHLNKLLNGEEIDVPSFDFETGHKEYKGQKMKLNDDEVLVIEGIHCLNDKLTFDIPKEKKYKIYISALTVLNVDEHNRIPTRDSRLIRRISRDSKFRNYPAIHTLKMWESVKRGEDRNIFPYQEEADSMFNTSLIYELGVLRTQVVPLLKEISPDEKEYPEAMRLYDFLRYFEPIPEDVVPSNSLLREFIGKGDFRQ